MTNKIIKDENLRKAYAAELWASRTLKKISYNVFKWHRLGLESAFWALQRQLI